MQSGIMASLGRNLLSATAMTAWMTMPSVAQQASPPSASAGELDEIVVTAQKRAQSVNNVPMSINTASGDELRALGVADARDLAKIVPGFTYAETNLTTPVYSIRGVGYYESSLAATPAVSVYVDQIPLTYPQMTRNVALDLQRVEVLKGPQGLLFGQNSTGGAVNYIAAKPSNILQAGVDLSIGRFGQGNVEGFVSGPIASTVNARVAIAHDYGGDWQYSYTRPGDTRGQTDVTKARVLVDWTPSDAVRFEFGVNGWIDKSHTQAPQLIGHTSASVPPLPAFVAFPLAPEDARAANWNPGYSLAKDDQFFQFSLRGDYDLTDHLTVTSLTSYGHLKLDDPIDADGSPFSIDNYDNTGSIKSFNQELRLAADFPTTHMLVGGNYSNDNTNDNQLDSASQSSNALANSVPPIPIDGILFKSTQSIQTLAAFAHLEQDLTDWATLEGGVRYTSDRRHFSGCLADPGDGGLANSFTFLYNVIGRPAVGQPGNVFIPPGGCVTATPLFAPVQPNGQLNQNNVSWRIGPTFKLNADTIVYANVSRGYKAGTFPTLGGVQASQFNPTRQESVVAYEIGSKATLLQRRLQVNGSVFYYNYDNKQILGAVRDPFFGPLQELVNVPKSHIYGAEVQLTAVPIEGLQVNVGGTYIQSEVTSHFNNFNSYGSPVDFYQSSFPYSPKWQGTADAQYTHRLSASLSAFLGGHFNYASKTTGAFGSNIPYDPAEHANPFGQIPNEPILAGALNIESYGLLDLRAGIASNDSKWRITLWGRNVTNKYYWNSASFIPADATVRFAGMPATYGATFTYRY